MKARQRSSSTDLPKGLLSTLRYRGFGNPEPIWSGHVLFDNDKWFSNAKDVDMAKKVASQGIDYLYETKRVMTRYEASRLFKRQAMVFQDMRHYEGFDVDTDPTYNTYKNKLWRIDNISKSKPEPERILIALLRRTYEKKPGVAHVKALLIYAKHFDFDGVILVTENGVTNPAKEMCGCGMAEDKPIEEVKTKKGKKKGEDEASESEAEEEDEEEEEPEEEEEIQEEEISEHLENGKDEEETIGEEEVLAEVIAEELASPTKSKRLPRIELMEYKELHYDATEHFLFPPLEILDKETTVGRLEDFLVNFHLVGSRARTEPTYDPKEPEDPEKQKRLLARAWKELEKLLPIDPICRLFALEEGDVVEMKENTLVGFEAKRNLRIVCRTNNVDQRTPK